MLRSLPLGLLWAFAWAAPTDARMAGAGDQTAGSPPPPAAEAPAAGGTESETGAEPEIVWLTDDQNRQYTVFELENLVENRDFMWLDEKRIRVKYGMEFEVLEHETDAEERRHTFSLKRYKPPERVFVPPPPPVGPSEEALRESAAAFDSGVASVDKLRLEPFDDGLPRAGQWRHGFDVADMNGDGHLDIVFGASRKGSPRPNIFLGDGQGRWRSWAEARFPAFPYEYGDAAAADFNSDGVMDLALGMHLRGILVLVGDGQGGFQTWSEGIGLEIPGQGGDGTTFSSRAIEAVDWNSDGRVDLLALGEGPKGSQRLNALGVQSTSSGPVYIHNHGDGSWEFKGYKSRIFGDHLAVGDFDGNGRPDFVTSSNSAGNYAVLNLGQGAESWETFRLEALRPGGFLQTVAAGRLDGDERDDLVAGFFLRELGVTRTAVDILYAGAEGEWRRRPLWAQEGKHGIWAAATGDLDGDGGTDVAFATGLGEVVVHLADGEGFFVHEESPELPPRSAGCRSYGLRLVDLDRDGRDELIAGFAGEAGGTPGFGVEEGCPQQGSLRVWTASVAAAPAESSTTR